MNDKDSLIQAQKEQIARYQTRLKDVVTAYKSLLVEKEALDAALSTKKPKEESIDTEKSENESSDPVEQISVLMNSIKTLSAEKNKMEASFLTDKKLLRQELSSKEKEIRDIQEHYKAKLANLDRIMNDERHLKENLETQLNQLKTQFAQTSNSDKVIASLNQEILELKKKLRSHENGNKDESAFLELQQEMENLKQQHITSLQLEKQKSNEANERNKKMIVLHEERVQSLEQRLSDLSNSVAHYHQLRESDQKSISNLKDKISQLNKNSEERHESGSDQMSRKYFNINHIVEEIGRLKQILIYESSKMDIPIDLSSILSYTTSTSDDVSFEKYSLLKNEDDKHKAENEILKNTLTNQDQHLRTLQEKVIVLNRNIDEYETEIRNKSISLNNELRAERNKCREQINSLEIDYRNKMSQLEQQLQRQRERSLLLLEEKENEIRTLKTSYELFIPKKMSEGFLEDDGQSSEGANRKTSSSHQHLGMILNHPSSPTPNIPETYMIFYSNELARKDIELTALRKAKRECDELIRQTLKEKIMIQEDLDEKIGNLEQKVYFLEKMKSREGANLEYLKNVTISYLTTADTIAKRKMLNAIAAVLKFDESEMTLVNNYFGKKK